MKICLENLTIILPTKDESTNIARFPNYIPQEINLIVVDNSDVNTSDIIKMYNPQYTKICGGALIGDIGLKYSYK